MNATDQRKCLILAALAAGAVLVVAAAPFAGMQRILPSDLAGGEETARRIFLQLRLPRVCVAFLSGAALAVSGMAFQAMFRNPLATPYTLGVSSGASLGAAVYVWCGLGFSVLGVSGVSLFAFAGAMFSLLMVYGFTRARRGFSASTMLLAGIAVSLFFSSLILFLQYLSDFTQSYQIMHWLLGGLTVTGFQPVWNILPFVAAGSAALMCFTRELNLLAAGDDIAAGRGVNVTATKKRLFFATSLMVGAVVACCGPIGFVGIIVPHTCRLMIGAEHRRLAPATWLLGGTFLALCDTLARTVIAPAEIPVGVITSLLGGPFFIWLLLSPRAGGSVME